MTEESNYAGVLAAAIARQYGSYLTPSHLRATIQPLLQKLLAYDNPHLTLGTSALIGLLLLAQPSQTVALLKSTDLAAVSEHAMVYSELGVPLNALTVGLTFVTERYVELRHPHYQRVALHGLLALLVHGGEELETVQLAVQAAGAGAGGVRTRSQMARVPTRDKYRLKSLGGRVLQVGQSGHVGCGMASSRCRGLGSSKLAMGGGGGVDEKYRGATVGLERADLDGIAGEGDGVFGRGEVIGRGCGRWGCGVGRLG